MRQPGTPTVGRFKVTLWAVGVLPARRAASVHERLNDAASLVDTDGRALAPALSATWHPTAVFRITVEDVRVVHRCGHGQEVLPIPAEDGKFDLVPVIGEAW